jgi:hypothetical protein
VVDAGLMPPVAVGMEPQTQVDYRCVGERDDRDLDWVGALFE